MLAMRVAMTRHVLAALEDHCEYSPEHSALRRGMDSRQTIAARLLDRLPEGAKRRSGSAKSHGACGPRRNVPGCIQWVVIWSR